MASKRDNSAKFHRKDANYFWSRLTNEDRLQISDSFVAGTFDWRVWFRKEPASAFMKGVRIECENWEIQCGLGE